MHTNTGQFWFAVAVFGFYSLILAGAIILWARKWWNEYQRVRRAKQFLAEFTNFEWDKWMENCRNEERLSNEFEAGHRTAGVWNDKWDSQFNEEVHKMLRFWAWENQSDLSCRLSRLGVDYHIQCENEAWDYYAWRRDVIEQLEARCQWWYQK